MTRKVAVLLLLLLLFSGCMKRGTQSNTNSTDAKDEGEKVRPAPGTGNGPGRDVQRGDRKDLHREDRQRRRLRDHERATKGVRSDHGSHLRYRWLCVCDDELRHQCDEVQSRG